MERIFFLHIPKTGGNTLRHIMQGQYPHSDLFVAKGKNFSRYTKNDLLKYRLYSVHTSYPVLAARIPDGTRVTTVLRNPIDRVISSYRHNERDPKWQYYPLIRSKNMSLLDFVTAPETKNSLSNDIVKRLAGPSEDLDLAKQRLESFAFFGLTEKMWESILLLCYSFGWRPPDLLPVLNVAPVTETSPSEYPEAAIDAIKERNSLDIQLYQWAEKLFNDRIREMEISLSNGVAPPKVLHDENLSASLTIMAGDRSNWIGWYRPIRNIRFSGPGTVSTVDIPLAKKKLCLRIKVPVECGRETVASTKIFLNDEQLHMSLNRRRVLKGVIEEYMVEETEPVSRLKFIAKTTVPMKIRGSARERMVGFGVEYIDVGPLSATIVNEMIRFVRRMRRRFSPIAIRFSRRFDRYL